MNFIEEKAGDKDFTGVKQGEVVILPAFGAVAAPRPAPRCTVAASSMSARSIWTARSCSGSMIALRSAPSSPPALQVSSNLLPAAGQPRWTVLHVIPICLSPSEPLPRSPGASVQEMKLLNERGVQIIDTTCPWVSKARASLPSFSCAPRAHVHGTALWPVIALGFGRLAAAGSSEAAHLPLAVTFTHPFGSSRALAPPPRPLSS